MTLHNTEKFYTGCLNVCPNLTSKIALSKFRTSFKQNHDSNNAQLLTINNIVAAVNLIPLKQRTRTRKINNDTIMQFQHLLKNETWESLYKDKDINNKYNSFLYTFLKIFEASFPIKYVSTGKIKNDWITQ
jgi:triphosphoribosyl-dephospho-CoA synthetase